MPLISDPAWPIYKAALARLAKAGAALESHQAKGQRPPDSVRQEFAAAVAAYDEARDGLRTCSAYPAPLDEAPEGVMELDGFPSRIGALRPGLSRIGVPQMVQGISED